MDPHVTREILWNIPVGFVVLLYGMLIPLTAAFIYAGLRWYRIVRLGATDPRPRFDQPARRLFMALRDNRRVRRPLYRHDDHLLQRPGRRGGRFFRFRYYLVGIIEVR